MDTGIKDLASKLFKGDDEVDRILGLPITQMRIELKNHFQDKSFSEDDFNNFVERLGKVDDLGGQAAVAKQAVLDRRVNDELDVELNTPAKQLLWAATLTRMMHTGNKQTGPVSRSPLWNQLQGTLGVNNEEISISRLISRALQNPEVVFDWGDQGSWFFYNPKTNRINIDMYYTLLMGFEHTHAAIGHEVGHSQLSNSYSKKMKELYEKVKIIVDPSTVTREDKDGKKQKRPRIKMKRAQYRQLMLDVAEWQLRFKLWHVVEDNAVNQFSANLDEVINQNFPKSLNHIAAALQGFGEIMGGLDENRDIRIATDKAPPAPGTHEREVWDDRQKKKEENAEKAKAKRLERIMREKTPLTEDELKDIQAGKMTKEIARKMFEQMNTAVLMAFYEQNGLFKGTDKSWERLRILPEDVRRAVDISHIPGTKGKDAFEYLVDLSVGQANPDPEIKKIPLERNRALKHLEALALDEEFAAVPQGRAEAMAYLLDKDYQKVVKKTFASLSAALGSQKPKKSQNEIADDMAREILARPGVLGPEAAAKLNDPFEELLRQQGLIPEKRAAKARELLARPKVLGPDDAAKVEDPIDELFTQMAKAWGIRNLQPNSADRLFVQPPYKTVGDSYRAVVEFTSEQRGKLMDHIWDTFLKPYADVILKARADKLDREQENKKKQQQQQKQDKGQKGKPQKGDKQEGDPQQGEGDEGEDQDSGGGGDSEPDIDDDDNSDGQGKQQSDIEIEDEENDGQSDNDDVELDDDDLDDISNVSDEPEKGHDHDDHDDDKGKKNDKDPSDDKDGDKSGWDKDDMPPPQRKENKKVGDLKDKEPANENLTPEQKEAAKQAAEQRKQDEQNGVSLDNNGKQTDFDVSQYATGKWTDFYDRMRELLPVIMHREAIYRKVLEEQRVTLRKQSVEKFTLLPRDGDFRGRLSRQRVLSKRFKKISHQVPNLEDLKQIKDDDIHFVDSSIESISLIDGSGSMKQKVLGKDAHGNDITAMDVALQSAAIDYLAARRAGIGAYLIMWGKDKPYVIATPSTPLEEVGRRLEGVREGLSSATALAPAFASSMEELGNFINKRNTISGTSLMTIYSDGEIQDFAKALLSLGVITKSSKNLSIEVAVLTSKDQAEARKNNEVNAEGKTKMEELFDEEIKKTGNRIVSVMRGNDAHEVPIEVGRRTVQRLRKFKVKLEDDKKKRARFKKIARALKDVK